MCIFERDRTVRCPAVNRSLRKQVGSTPTSQANSEVIMKDRQELLGMGHGKASHILLKKILFECVQSLGRDECYRCKKKITTIDTFSIEHKNAWMQAENPVEAFFDLNNIAFSHRSCNYKAATKVNKKYFTEDAKQEAYRERDRERWHNKNRAEQRKEKRRLQKQMGV
jgi:hypothetical protein